MHFQDIDTLVAARVEELVEYIDSSLVPLVIRRMLAGPTTPVTSPGPPSRDVASPEPKRAPPAPDGPAPLGRGLASHVILSALSVSPPEGLHGRDLNKLMFAAGLTIDTAEAWKTRLRHRGVLDHDLSTGLWSLTPSVKLAYPDLSRIAPPMPNPRNRHVRKPGGRAGGIIRSALAKRGGTVPSAELYAAVTAAGYSASTAKHALNEMRIAGLITSDGKRWHATSLLSPDA